jgi:hypothetical protein
MSIKLTQEKLGKRLASISQKIKTCSALSGAHDALTEWQKVKEDNATCNKGEVELVSCL